jgi:glycosyltransferase involved in cell wall biosynthesis
MRSAWETLANELGISDRVHWLGWRAQPECAQLLRGASALLLPSIYECGGAVVPVIATAWGGPADYIDPTCGILVDPSNPQAILDGFIRAMHTLAADPALCARLGAAGRQRVEEHFDWNRKIDAMLNLYRKAIDDFHAQALRN